MCQVDLDQVFLPFVDPFDDYRVYDWDDMIMDYNRLDVDGQRE